MRNMLAGKPDRRRSNRSYRKTSWRHVYLCWRRIAGKSVYNNKTTRVWFLREQKHRSDGLWPRKHPRPQVDGVSRPKTITSVVLYLSSATKTTEKLLLIPEFHTPRGNPYCTYFLSDIFFPRPDTTARSPDSTGQIVLVFYDEIYRVGDSARCRINFARKGILVCVF
jgi:hypothetical protein